MCKTLAAILAITFTSALTGCSSSSSCESAGRKEFQKEHPDFTIVEIDPDGNDVAVMYVAHYKKPDDEKIHFAYVSVENNKTHKCEVSIHEF